MKSLHNYICEGASPDVRKQINAAAARLGYKPSAQLKHAKYGEILRACISSEIGEVKGKIKEILDEAGYPETEIKDPVSNSDISGKYKPYPVVIDGMTYFIVNSKINNGIKFENQLADAFNDSDEIIDKDIKFIVKGIQAYYDSLGLDSDELTARKTGTSSTRRGFDVDTVSVPGGNIGSTISDLETEADGQTEYLSLKNGKSHICNFILRGVSSDVEIRKAFFKKLGANPDRVEEGLEVYGSSESKKRARTKYEEVSDNSAKSLWARLLNDTVGCGYWYCNLKNVGCKPVLFRIDSQPEMKNINRILVKYPNIGCKSVIFELYVDGIDVPAHVEIRNTKGGLYPNQFMIDMSSIQMMQYCGQKNYLENIE